MGAPTGNRNAAGKHHSSGSRGSVRHGKLHLQPVLHSKKNRLNDNKKIRKAYALGVLPPLN